MKPIVETIQNEQQTPKRCYVRLEKMGKEPDKQEVVGESSKVQTTTQTTLATPTTTPQDPNKSSKTQTTTLTTTTTTPQNQNKTSDTHRITRSMTAERLRQYNRVTRSTSSVARQTFLLERLEMNHQEQNNKTKKL